MFIFVLFFIYGLFLFAMPPLVRQVTMLPSSLDLLVPPRPVTWLFVLLFLFVSGYYLGHCSF